jgi:hypothetical protein
LHEANRIRFSKLKARLSLRWSMRLSTFAHGMARLLLANARSSHSKGAIFQRPLLNGDLHGSTGNPGGAELNARHSCCRSTGNAEVHAISVNRSGTTDLVHNFSRPATYQHFDR